ncbi:MAG: hypothetical protein OXU20_06280 [Myxococcales bacterium]|nr:hypothetical protein [Myxococcales bacterium]
MAKGLPGGWTALQTAGLACAVLLLAASTVVARQHSEFAYPLSRVWTSAVRLMRVDYASPITEKDREDGYFLFEYPYKGKAYPGSVEVVHVGEPDSHRVRVIIQVPGMPSYVERMMLDRLRRKLEADFGPPGVGSRKPTEAPKKDSKRDEAPGKGEHDGEHEGDRSDRDGEESTGEH